MIRKAPESIRKYFGKKETSTCPRLLNGGTKDFSAANVVALVWSLSEVKCKASCRAARFGRLTVHSSASPTLTWAKLDVTIDNDNG